MQGKIVRLHANVDVKVPPPDHDRRAAEAIAAAAKNDTLAAIEAIVEREPDGERAVEAVADIIMNDPLGTFLAIADAEAAEGADAGNDREAMREVPAGNCPTHQALL